MDSGGDVSATRQSPFLPIFEQFRLELDEHHDRRDRIIKATRDITASSKKIIFALQRIRQLNKPLPQNISKSAAPHLNTIQNAFRAIKPDLQSINAHRYARQVTGGIQEYMEAVFFQHYLETQTLLSYDDAAMRLDSLLVSPDADEMQAAQKWNHDQKQERDVHMSDADINPQVQPLLTPYDYILGLFDMTGEVMRFAITSMATSAFLQSTSTDTTDRTLEQSQRPRTVLIDLQTLRMCLEVLNYDYKSDGRFARDAEGKLKVTRASVEKVEKALYGLVVRGSERPEGWMPDIREAAGEEVEAY